MLADACLVPLTTNCQASYEPDTSVVHVEDVPSCTAATRIIDWSRGKPLPVQVKPIDPQKLLTSDKTYLLFGLGGELGQSLCRWMATNGATHIIVAHRNPSTNTRWLEELRETGITINVISLDVTDKTALQNFCDHVQKTWPSVAGIANGAMVLKDKLFADMSYEDLNQVLRPKVLGSKHLDEIFGDQPLDFFILFSSLACVFGNVGQSNYAAANLASSPPHSSFLYPLY
jgi:hybrid polyketide synthase/nonribosomal peptide synthetase ACE1